MEQNTPRQDMEQNMHEQNMHEQNLPWQNMSQKIIWWLVTVLLVVWVFWYKYYSKKSVRDTNTFVTYYNKQVSADKSLILSINSATTSVNENLLKNSRDASQDMVDKWCKYLKNDDVEKQCIDLYTKYVGILDELKNWYTKETADKFGAIDTDFNNFAENLKSKEDIKFQ